jgi:hypothetical protein
MKLCVGIFEMQDEAPPYFKQFQIRDPNNAEVCNNNTIGDLIGAQCKFNMLKVGSEFIGTREEIESVAKKLKKSIDVPIPNPGFPTMMIDD